MSLALVLCCHQHAPGRHQERRNRELEQVRLGGAAGQARRGARRRVPDDVRRLGAQMGESRKRLAVAVRASRTTLTGIFGVGPVIAATVLDDAADVSRLASRDHFAACNGTAPVEVSCGNRWACGFPAHQIHHPHGPRLLPHGCRIRSPRGQRREPVT